MNQKTLWYVSKYANISKYGLNTRQSEFCYQFADIGYDTRLIISNSSHLFSNLPKFKGVYFHEQVNGVEVTWINTPSYTSSTSVKRVLGWLWFELAVMALVFRSGIKKPNIVIASSLSLMSVLSGAFYKRFFGAEFIFEVRDIWPKTIVYLKNMSAKHPLIWLLGKVERFGYHYSDAIVGTMPGLHLHVDEVVTIKKAVNFIPHGFNLAFYDEPYQKAESSIELMQQLSSTKFVVTYAGTFGQANALEYIIDAAKKMYESHRDSVQFVFVGDGSLKSDMQSECAKYSNITFLPAVERKQLPDLLKSSDLLVASVRDEPLYDYGLSLNKFIDYMFASRPIVCMFSGYPSMLNEANCGEFIPAEDADALVDSVLKYKEMTPEQRAEIGDSGYQYLMQHRTFEKLAKQYEKIFC
ncbi:MAG: glycosyltransferase family 4 protein [Glaciecola sp.]